MRAIFEDRCANCGWIIPAAWNTDEPIQFCPACRERARIADRGYRAACEGKEQRTLTGDTRREE